MVSTFGVETVKKEPDTLEGGQPEFDWNRFRSFARLDKKTDESLSRYFRSFVAMCRRVCHLRPGREGTTAARIKVSVTVRVLGDV